MIFKTFVFGGFLFKTPALRFTVFSHILGKEYQNYHTFLPTFVLIFAYPILNLCFYSVPAFCAKHPFILLAFEYLLCAGSYSVDHLVKNERDLPSPLGVYVSSSEGIKSLKRCLTFRMMSAVTKV